jgi:UDP-glucose 4,6-dehydratase
MDDLSAPTHTAVLRAPPLCTLGPGALRDGSPVRGPEACVIERGPSPPSAPVAPHFSVRSLSRSEILALLFRSASHVVIQLVKKYPQYRIVNFDKLDYCSSLKNLESVSGAPNYTFVKVRAPPMRGNPPRAPHPPPDPSPPLSPPRHTQGSITSADLVNYVLRVERVDTIMHFAAQTHVDNSFGNSITFTEANILGTHVLLEAAKEARVRLFIHVSTDEVYGEGETGVPSHEGSPLEPTNPYSATKAGAEYLVKAYHRSFNLPVIITRGNNVYGPHQYPEKIIPKFVNQLMRGLPLTLHGTGSNTRNYLYVEDVARAFDVILHRGKVGDIYNIGGSNEVSNVDVARALLRLMGLVERAGGSLSAAEAAHIIFVPDRPFNDLRYPLDCKRLNDLGWKEEVAWDAGLAKTVAWYGKYSGNWSDVESALVAHPRRGWTGKTVVEGRADADDDEDDKVASIIRGRVRAGSIASVEESAAIAGGAGRG